MKSLMLINRQEFLRPPCETFFSLTIFNAIFDEVYVCVKLEINDPKSRSVNHYKIYFAGGD